MSIRAEVATQLDSPTRISAVAFDNYEGRTQALANALGGSAWYLRSAPRQQLLVPVRYLIDSIRMWRLLRLHRPRVLLVVAPPVVPPLVALLWNRMDGCDLVVDCHTGAFHSPKWRWLTWLLKPVCRRAVATLVHTEGDEERVRSWGAVVILLPDELPEPEQAGAALERTRPCVVVAGSLDGNEPVEATLEAARLVPDIELRFTGDPARVPSPARRQAPANVVFTGWLHYPQFLGELLAAQVVAVFSTDPHIMNRAAFEAIGLGRPLVLSDLPGLRSRFGPAALFTPNEPPAMAHALRQALADREGLARKSVEHQAQLQMQHRQALSRLKAMLEARGRASSGGSVGGPLR